MRLRHTLHVLFSGRCWLTPEGRTLWPLWGYAMRERNSGRPAVLPWWLRFYANALDRHADLFCALPLWPAFWLWNRWQYWRWIGEKWGERNGWFLLKEEGGYWCEGHWAGIGERFPTIEERVQALKQRIASRRSRRETDNG